MKKIYVSPKIKILCLPDSLLNAPIGSGEIDPDDFVLGAKEMNLGDESRPEFTFKNVWDD